MAYIGNTPAEAFSSFQKQDFSTSATTSYTLDHPVSNQNEIALFINFVRQEPTAAYTASGTTLTLTSATSSSDDMYCVYLGKAVQTVNPASGSVGSSQVASTIITGQTAETSIATDDTVLIHDTSAGALRKMTRSNFVSGLGGLEMADQFRLSSSYTSIPQDTATLITANIERVDAQGGGTLGSNMSESSGIFTFPSTGIYLIHFHGSVQRGSSSYIVGQIRTTTNNSSYGSAATGYSWSDGSDKYDSFDAFFMFDVTDTSTHKCGFYVYKESGSRVDFLGSTNTNETTFTFLKLGAT